MWKFPINRTQIESQYLPQHNDPFAAIPLQNKLQTNQQIFTQSSKSNSNEFSRFYGRLKCPLAKYMFVDNKYGKGEKWEIIIFVLIEWKRRNKRLTNFDICVSFVLFGSWEFIFVMDFLIWSLYDLMKTENYKGKLSFIWMLLFCYRFATVLLKLCSHFVIVMLSFCHYFVIILLMFCYCVVII